MVLRWNANIRCIRDKVAARVMPYIIYILRSFSSLFHIIIIMTINKRRSKLLSETLDFLDLFVWMHDCWYRCWWTDEDDGYFYRASCIFLYIWLAAFCKQKNNLQCKPKKKTMTSTFWAWCNYKLERICNDWLWISCFWSTILLFIICSLHIVKGKFKKRNVNRVALNWTR